MWNLDIFLRPCLLCVICNHATASIPYYTNLTYIQISFLGVCVCRGGPGGLVGQYIDIVSPNRYVNIQLVFWRCRSRADVGLDSLMDSAF